MTARFPELGFHTLGGRVESPRVMLDELRPAERIGFGTAFLSERSSVREAASLTGAVTETPNIATAATSHNTGHPMRLQDRIAQVGFEFGDGRGVRTAAGDSMRP